MDKPKHAGGRPPTYDQELVEKARVYLAQCIDESFDRGGERPQHALKVKIPTKGGLAVYLGVARETLFDWAKKYQEFSNIMEQMGAVQEERLINNGLSGDYNPTIAKVLLTKHGYREGIDQTTNDKDIPTPILNVQRDNSVSEDK